MHTGASLLYTFPENIKILILTQKFDFGDFGTFLPDLFEFLNYDFPENFIYNLPQCGMQCNAMFIHYSEPLINVISAWTISLIEISASSVWRQIVK